MSKRLLRAHGLPAPTPANRAAIANAASRNPREIETLLESLRDLMQAGQGTHQGGKGYDTDALLAFVGITHDGLDRTAQKYLRVLLSYEGDPVGESTLKMTLNEPALDSVERMLTDMGLIKRTPRGRMLTRAGMDRAEKLARA